MGDRSAPHMCTATTACADLVVPNFEHEDHLKRFVISRYPPFPQPAYIALRLPTTLLARMEDRPRLRLERSSSSGLI